ncbi:MAG: hypothetical protein KTR32_32020 [Granulosicoccus sp.]|nr:hypothetical protein [Granulosicoccus sp.]
MKTQIRSIAIAFALTLAGTAQAGTQSIDIDAAVQQIAPMQAHTMNLGDYTAVVYYTELANGNFNVITTVGPNVGIAGSITQHQVELSPGQQYSLNVDQGADTDVALNLEAQVNSISIY